MKNKTYNKKKILVVFVCAALILCALIGRLVWLMIFDAEYYQELAQDLHEREREIKAARGEIVDRNGVVLATNRTVCTISVIHSQVEDPERVIEVLCSELEMEESEVREKVEKVSSMERIRTNVDKETGEYRRVQYRDIVILTRSIRGWAEAFTSVLAEEGIPAYSVSREGYFETYEVSVLLDYLKILDNVRQDLPLTAVLTSPFCGLDASALAEIRLAFPEAPFYEAAMAYAQDRSGEEDAGEVCSPSGRGKLPWLVEKLSGFFATLGYFRERVPYTPIHELLEEIIEKTGYGTFLLAMPGGGQRAANVEMLVERAASFEGTCQQKHISIELVLTGDQLYVNADMGKIQQVLYNLLDNAIKFSHNDSSIRIETTEKNTKVFVSVKDSGIGIPRDSLKLIWDRFYKTDLSRGKDKKGTGLGLSITKEIIQAHSENINVISTEGEGTEFIFSLPLSEEDDD